MNLTVRNLAQISSGTATPAMQAEAIVDLLNLVGNMADQVNANPNGKVAAPPPPSILNVVSAGGVFDLQIQDSSPVARGIIYHIEYSTSAGFTPATLVYSGPSRNFRAFLGNQTLYFRAFSQYPTSDPSPPVYFGGQATPTAVVGGGAITGPVPQNSAGSGTSPTSGASGRPEGFGFNPVRGNPRLAGLI